MSMETNPILPQQLSLGDSWQVLVVDPDNEVIKEAANQLTGFLFDERSVELLRAQSLAEGQRLLDQYPNLAILFIGALPNQEVQDLLVYLRDQTKNHWTRVVCVCQGKEDKNSPASSGFLAQAHMLHQSFATPDFLTHVISGLKSYREMLSALAFSSQGPGQKSFYLSDAVAIFKWKAVEHWPVEYVSLNVEQILGYTEKDFISGQVVYSAIIFKEDLERVTQEVGNYTISPVSRFDQEYRVVTKAGKVIWVYDYTVKIFNEAGGITHFVGYVFDITQSRQNSGPQSDDNALLQLNEDFHIFKLNPKMAALLGASIEEATGEDLRGWLTQQGRLTLESHGSMVAISSLPQRFELELCRGKVNSKCNFVMTPNLAPQDQKKGFHCFVEDLNAQGEKEAELQLELQKERAFIASASHELRTPLSSILGYAELLKGARNLDPEQNSFLENILTNSKHLVTLVNDILDLSKIESNQLSLNNQEVVFSDLFTSSGVMISNRVKEGVKLVVSAPDLEHYVLCDPVRIKQIFLNLLSNAAKFTDEGAIRLFLAEYTPIDQNLFSVRIVVEDTGPGIPKDRQSELFKPFRQVHNGSYGGTGLGLYLSRQIARLMDGDITLDSDQGKGTIFTIELVLARGRLKGEQFAFKDRRVLILGDYPTLSDQQKEKLTLTGAQIVFIDCIDPNQTGRFREITAFDHVDLAIIDLDVLKDRSLYYAGALKETYPQISIIGLKQKANDLYFDLLDQNLLKPFSYFQLATALDEEFKRYKPRFRVDFSELKVLIVEDVEANRMLFSQMFQKFFDLTPETAKNGKLGVAAVKKNKYDVVFMDVEMPIMNGIDATNLIRQFDKTTPIFAMTGNVFAEDIQETKDAGMSGFLSKPIQKEELERALMSLFEKDDTAVEPSVFAEESNEVLAERSAPALNQKEWIKERMISQVSLLSDDPRVVKEIVDTALVEIKEVYAQLGQLYAVKDFVLLGKALHKLKGVLLNLDVQPFGTHVAELEGLVKNGGDSNAIDQKMNDLLSEYLELAD